MNRPESCFERSTGLVGALWVWMISPTMVWLTIWLSPPPCCGRTGYFLAAGLTLVAIIPALVLQRYRPTNVKLVIRADDSFRLSYRFLFGARSHEGRLSEIIRVRQIDTEDETFQVDMRVTLRNAEVFDLDVRDWKRLSLRLGLTGDLLRESGGGTIDPSYVDASRLMKD
jgi:hypothetical protein